MFKKDYIDFWRWLVKNEKDEDVYFKGIENIVDEYLQQKSDE